MSDGNFGAGVSGDVVNGLPEEWAALGPRVVSVAGAVLVDGYVAHPVAAVPAGLMNAHPRGESRSGEARGRQATARARRAVFT